MLSELLSAFVLLSQGAVSTGPAFSSDQFTLDSGHGGDNIDIITGSQFYGLTTFAHVPYANCFIDSEAEKVSYDIAFLGAPFDTVGCNITLLATYFLSNILSQGRHRSPRSKIRAGGCQARLCANETRRRLEHLHAEE